MSIIGTQTVSLLEGKIVKKYEGDIDEINSQIQSSRMPIASGAYFLDVTRGSGKTEHFKLVKL